ncbi:MAG: nuclear transport factor 2 family protein [Acidimicrobiia bacterium]|nr:nuclear transport factor 2 family protein [Acidimicrobiia bacterium]
MTDTTTDTTTATTAVVDAYIAMWNEEDPARRAALIAAAWAPDAAYLDPMLEARGHDGLGAMVAGVHAQFPGHRFRRLTAVDVHHDRVRFGWELAAPDGAVTVAGIDVGTLAADGRLQTITGYFGELATA